jgi:hypothetical protein
MILTVCMVTVLVMTGRGRAPAFACLFMAMVILSLLSLKSGLSNGQEEGAFKAILLAMLARRRIHVSQQVASNVID